MGRIKKAEHNCCDCINHYCTSRCTIIKDDKRLPCNGRCQIHNRHYNCYTAECEHFELEELPSQIIENYL